MHENKVIYYSEIIQERCMSMLQHSYNIQVTFTNIFVNIQSVLQSQCVVVQHEKASHQI